MWTQYKAWTTKRLSGINTSALYFWKNEHGEIHKDIDQRDLEEFLKMMSLGHKIECDSTGEELKE